MTHRAVQYMGLRARRDKNEAVIATALRAIGCVVVRHSGTDEPDLFVLHNGAWTALEVKSEKGKLTQGQVAFRAIVRSMGSEVHVVRDANEALKVVTGRQCK